MDLERIKAIAVLGYNFNLHMLRWWFARDKRDQAEVFKGYFRDDRIAALSREEHRELVEFGTCTACGLCPPRCRVMEFAGGRFRGPLHLASSASRSQPDFIHDLDSLVLCAACGQCEPVCPAAVPVARLALAMRSFIWRVAAESMPEAYQKARENLIRHGSVYGPAPALDLPAGGKTMLVLGPALRRKPEAALRAAEVLQKCGLSISLAPDGEIGGLAADLGLEPDTGWVDALAKAPGEVIVADPEIHAALLADGRLKGRLRFITEAVLAGLPAGFTLQGKAEGPVTAHDGRSSARGSVLGRVTRELIARLGLPAREMEESGPDSPPAGWEGGLALIDPELASALAQARLDDGQRAGAKLVVAIGFDDAMIMDGLESEGTRSVYLIDLIHSGL